MGSRRDNGDSDVVLKIMGSIASRLFCGLFYVVIYSSWRIVLNFRLLSPDVVVHHFALCSFWQRANREGIESVYS